MAVGQAGLEDLVAAAAVSHSEAEAEDPEAAGPFVEGPSLTEDPLAAMETRELEFRNRINVF